MQYYHSTKEGLFPTQKKPTYDIELSALQNILCSLKSIPENKKSSFLHGEALSSSHLNNDGKIQHYQEKICGILNINNGQLLEVRKSIISGTNSNVGDISAKPKLQEAIDQLSKEERGTESSILLGCLLRSSTTQSINSSSALTTSLTYMNTDTSISINDEKNQYDECRRKVANESARHYVHNISQHTHTQPETIKGKITKVIEYSSAQILEYSNAVACAYTGAVATLAYRDATSNSHNTDENDLIAWGTSMIACVLYSLSAMNASIKSIKAAKQDDNEREIIVKTIDGLLENATIIGIKRNNLELYKAIVRGAKVESLMQNKKYAPSIIFRTIMNGGFEFVNAVKSPIGKLCMKIAANCFAPSALFEAVGTGETYHRNEKTKQNAHMTLSLLLYISQNTTQSLSQDGLIEKYITDNAISTDDMQNIILCLNHTTAQDIQGDAESQPLDLTCETSPKNGIVRILQEKINEQNAHQQPHTSSATVRNITRNALPLIGAGALLATSWGPSLYEQATDNTNITGNGTQHWAGKLNDQMSGQTGIINSVVGTATKMIATSVVIGVLKRYRTLSNVSKTHLSWMNVRHCLAVLPLSLGQMQSVLAKHLSPISDTIFVFITDKLAGQSHNDNNALGEQLIEKMTEELQKEEPHLSIVQATERVCTKLTQLWQECQDSQKSQER
ncbi:MAG: hypothetical protein ACI9CD_001055 [Candidatus Deianiraeaceae bacterium]|jgi:hypothetical protein